MFTIGLKLRSYCKFRMLCVRMSAYVRLATSRNGVTDPFSMKHSLVFLPQSYCPKMEQETDPNPYPSTLFLC